MKAIYYCFLALILIVLGCTETTTILPAEAELTSITINGLPEDITAFEGLDQEASFSVLLQSEAGVGLPGKTVQLEVVSGVGFITPESATTDANGLINAVLTVRMPTKDKILQISVYTETEITFAGVQLYRLRMPATLQLRVNGPYAPNEVFNIYATVKDQRSQALKDVRLDFSLIPVDGDDAAFELLTPISLTNELGVAVAECRVVGIEGSQNIRCVVADDNRDNPLSAELTLEFTPAQFSIVLHAGSDHIYADGEGGSMTSIMATLVDESGAAIPAEGDGIMFSTDNEYAVLQISENGYGGQLDYLGNPREDREIILPTLVTITARYENASSTIGVTILRYNPVSRIDLFVSARQLVANSGDSSAVRATCFLADGSPAPVDTKVRFQSNYGSFADTVAFVTGNAGQAFTYYIAGDEIGTAYLTAIYLTEGNSVISNEVHIDLIAGSIANIELSADPSRITAGGSSRIMATLTDISGFPVRSGTYVSFSTTLGTITTSAITDENGEASAMFTGVTTSDSVGIIASSGGLSDTIWVTIEPGGVGSIELSADPTEIPLQGHSTITAILKDDFGNPVRQGTYMSFSATMGTITPSAITDVNGVATAMFRPGIEAGRAGISAGTDTVWVTILPDGIGTIEFEVDPLSIPVVTGRSTLTVTNKDANGNLIPSEATIGIQLLGEDQDRGSYFGNEGVHEFYGNLSTGEISVVLHAGEYIGGKVIRMVVWQDSANYPDEFNEAITSRLSVVAGPPAMLDIDINNEGEDAGDGNWAVEVLTRVYDEFRNPVSDENFELALSVEPPIAEIVDNNRLIFDNEHIGETVRIIATVRTEDGEISGERYYTLPLLEGVLELTVDPQNWMFEEGHEVAEIACTTILTNGHGFEIDNIPVLLTANRGKFGWKDEEGELHLFYPDPVRTGSGDTVYLIAEEDDVFLDPFTLEVTVQVNARVEGYDDVSADPDFIFFTRHAE